MGSSDSSWLIEFKGRNRSGAFEDNFLWRKDNIYIMDNHRLALWCWFQHLDSGAKYNLLHIDAHSDTLTSRLEDWMKDMPDMWTVDLQSYRTASYYMEDVKETVPLFHWDNYLSLFFAGYKEILNVSIFAVHEADRNPGFDNINYVELRMLPENLDYWMEKEDGSFIVNVDLDYFVCPGIDSTKIRMCSDTYIEHISRQIDALCRKGKIAVLTISLSPETTGNWRAAEDVCSIICRSMQLDFALDT